MLVKYVTKYFHRSWAGFIVSHFSSEGLAWRLIVVKGGGASKSFSPVPYLEYHNILPLEKYVMPDTG